jgi:hypothetical protein
VPIARDQMSNFQSSHPTTQRDSHSKPTRTNTFPKDTNPHPNHGTTIGKKFMNMPTLRIHTTQSTKINAIPANKRMSNPAKIKMTDKIREHLRSKTMARIPQCYMHLR